MTNPTHNHTTPIVTTPSRITSEYRWISPAECAKLVRAALKAAYPTIKFGVRTKTYSGGSSITVSWTDGPTVREAERIYKQFEGADFDGMIDLKTHNGPVLLNGEMVRFGVDYIFGARHESFELVSKVAAAVCQVTGETGVSVVQEPGSFSGELITSIKGAWHSIPFALHSLTDGQAPTIENIASGIAHCDWRPEQLEQMIWSAARQVSCQ